MARFGDIFKDDEFFGDVAYLSGCTYGEQLWR